LIEKRGKMNRKEREKLNLEIEKLKLEVKKLEYDEIEVKLRVFWHIMKIPLATTTFIVAIETIAKF